MSTFDQRYGSGAMLDAVAVAINDLQKAEGESVEIHTLHLERSGNHGEFDLTVKATDDKDGFLEDREWVGIAYRYGGTTDLEEVEV